MAAIPLRISVPPQTQKQQHDSTSAARCREMPRESETLAAAASAELLVGLDSRPGLGSWVPQICFTGSQSNPAAFPMACFRDFSAAMATMAARSPNKDRALRGLQQQMLRQPMRHLDFHLLRPSVFVNLHAACRRGTTCSASSGHRGKSACRHLQTTA